MPTKKDDLPSPVERPPAKIRDTYATTLARAAVEHAAAADGRS
jgi:hypothetical protein